MSKKLKRFSQSRTRNLKGDIMTEMIQSIIDCTNGTGLADAMWESHANKRVFVLVVYGTILALGRDCKTCKCSLYKEATEHTLDFLEHGLRLIGMHQTASQIRGDFGALLRRLHCRSSLEAETNMAFELVKKKALSLVSL